MVIYDEDVNVKNLKIVDMILFLIEKGVDRGDAHSYAEFRKLQFLGAELSESERTRRTLVKRRVYRIVPERDIPGL